MYNVCFLFVFMVVKVMYAQLCFVKCVPKLLLRHIHGPSMTEFENYFIHSLFVGNNLVLNFMTRDTGCFEVIITNKLPACFESVGN